MSKRPHDEDHESSSLSLGVPSSPKRSCHRDKAVDAARPPLHAAAETASIATTTTTATTAAATATPATSPTDCAVTYSLSRWDGSHESMLDTLRTAACGYKEWSTSDPQLRWTVIEQCVMDAQQQTRLIQHGWSPVFDARPDGTVAVVRNSHFRRLPIDQPERDPRNPAPMQILQRFDLLHQHHDPTTHTITSFGGVRVYLTFRALSDVIVRLQSIVSPPDQMMSVTSDANTFDEECTRGAFPVDGQNRLMIESSNYEDEIDRGLDWNLDAFQRFRKRLAIPPSTLLLNQTIRKGLLWSHSDCRSYLNADQVAAEDMGDDLRMMYDHWSRSDRGRVVLPAVLHTLISEYLGPDAVADSAATQGEADDYRDELERDHRYALIFCNRFLAREIRRERTAQVPVTLRSGVRVHAVYGDGSREAEIWAIASDELTSPRTRIDTMDSLSRFINTLNAGPLPAGDYLLTDELVWNTATVPLIDALVDVLLSPPWSRFCPSVPTTTCASTATGASSATGASTTTSSRPSTPVLTISMPFGLRPDIGDYLTPLFGHVQARLNSTSIQILKTRPVWNDLLGLASIHLLLDSHSDNPPVSWFQQARIRQDAASPLSFISRDCPHGLDS